METLGQKLRKAREQKGWSVDEAASRLKIHVKYFHAIEADDTASLPGSFFYRSFVRQYASLVGLPDNAYAAELDSAAQTHLEQITREQPDSVPVLEYQVPPMPTAIGDPREETKRWVLRFGLLVLVMGLSSGGYMLWQRWKTFSDEQAQASKAQTSQPPVQKPVEQPPPQPVTTEPQTQPDTASTTTADPNAQGAQGALGALGTQGQPGSNTASNQPTTPPATIPPSSPPVPATTPASTAAPATKSPVGVTLTARESVWVDVWADGKRVHSNALAAGESKSFSASGQLRVRYGNAGGIEVQWNGKPTEAPGPRGQVRTWDYQPEGYRMIPVAPKTPPAAPPQAAQ